MRGAGERRSEDEKKDDREDACITSMTCGSAKENAVVRWEEEVSFLRNRFLVKGGRRAVSEGEVGERQVSERV